ncbi:uncharacterized protein KY384_002525 [Bacidia gigantensis]|uniref:uncharacterized protein n=1 Tax=Bacidia gigantensis TaxID=2732470 RepID=UPI001D047FC4|nr:uncharacterized protein KY384_002525 [Bacidia gigantensis]KAG8532648.1 hypothetical protein KY384_002525 [Bacidia gigantensis]
MAVFDFPLRVCAWLAQMKAGMWVRNGLSLRHQMNTYRGLAHRDLAHHRDIFLLQTALVVCDCSRVLASMIDRFALDQWMRGIYTIREGFEVNQQLDVAEDFIHLFIVLLSDRTSLQHHESAESARAAAIRRDVAHILCFKPLSFSELDQRFADKSTDLEVFSDILDEMTSFKPPEGLSDTGTFELKPQFLAEIDPYAAHYTKNQRDEAENTYRNWISKQYGKPAIEVVYEPRLVKIHHGIFQHIAQFTRSPLFSQIVFHSLFVSSNTHKMPDIPSTRIEAYLHVVLHLVLIAVIEDNSQETDSSPTGQGTEDSFISNALEIRSELGMTIFDLLVKMLETSDLRLCHPQIRLILRRIRQRQPATFESAASRIIGELSVENLGVDAPMTPGEDEQEARQREARKLKKQQALDRQARVMAQFQQQQQNFLKNQDLAEWDDEDDTTLGISSEDQNQVWKFPAGNCILCQEETNDARLYGTFGLIMNSNVFRNTDVKDPAALAEVLKTPDNLDQAAEDLRPFGIAGSNLSHVTKRSADGREVTKEHQGLASGFPSHLTIRGPVSTGCGHIMHYSCFEMYCSATQVRQNHQIARQHPERTDLKEFVCPLCKALGNAFLPIIWRSKEEVSNSILHCQDSFEEWLSSRVGVTVSRFFKTQEGRSDNERLQELSARYISASMISSIANNVSTLSQESLKSPISPQVSSRSFFSGMPGLWQSNAENLRSPDRHSTGDATQASELMVVYSRLKDTMITNHLPSRFAVAPEVNSAACRRLSNIDTLARILGESITSAEIAQRGVQSELGQTLIEKMPLSVLTHLRIFAETVSSYTALGVKAAGEPNMIASEVSDITRSQLFQLFNGHPHVENDATGSLQRKEPSVFVYDAFALLVECTFTLAPVFNFEFGHLLRLCYTLETVKVALYLATSPATFQACYEGNESISSYRISSSQQTALQHFLHQLYHYSLPNVPTHADHDGHWEDVIGLPSSPEWYSLLYRAVSRYALTFLRKVTILAHVRYSVNFPDSEPESSSVGLSELERLTHLLQLPTLSEIFLSIGQNEYPPTILQNVTAGWLDFWRYTRGSNEQSLHASDDRASFAQSVYESFKPRHPAIYELIGLPKHFDTLTYEATRRRCPTTGGRLEDPNLCIFCGDIFCGQALCCTSKQGKGGCFQHMLKKCTVLYLHNQNGSWNLAPYLDKFGEPDPGLRRGRQLTLNQKRYDKLLRDVWLQQGIPTMIARKLEAELNNGGWETL